MTEPVFAADPLRLLIAAAAGILLLLLLIIKFKIHPVLSLLIAALVIGLGAGMPVPTLVSTVENGAGETLQGIIPVSYTHLDVYKRQHTLCVNFST